MYEISYNIVFVYCLLIIDLIINITDHLLDATTTVVVATNDVQVDPKQSKDINSVAFIVVIIQIFAIISVVTDLVLHFFQVSDQVCQFAMLQLCQRNSANAGQGSREKNSQKIPMPQRIALKLVVEKYWWSLLVGLLYLVLTIILQIIRLSPDWKHHRGNLNNGKLIALLNSDISGVDDLKVSHHNLRMDKNEFIVNSEEESIVEDLGMHNTGSGSNDKAFSSLNKNLLPVIILLIHKLMSTCYYVSFVVVYRATLSQKVNRIFVNKSNMQLVSSCSQ